MWAILSTTKLRHATCQARHRVPIHEENQSARPTAQADNSRPRTRREAFACQYDTGDGVRGFTSFMPSAFGPETYPDTAESPSPQRNFNITAGFNGAPTEIGPSGIVVYYFEAHLSQSCIWLNDLESLFVPKTQISWISSGIPPRIGSSGFSGASPHFYLDVPGVGNKAIPIPIPPAPPGVITGHKWNDVIVNGEYETEDLPIEGWAITCSGIANGETVSFTAKTDSTGIYTFLLLPLGTWTITEASGIEGWLSSSPTSIEVVLPLPSGSPYGPADAFGAKNVDFFNYQPSSATTTLLSAETITLGESVYDTFFLPIQSTNFECSP